MELSSVIEQATRAHAAPLAGTREAAVSGLDAVRQLRAWCDSIEIDCGRVIETSSSFPQAAIGEPLRLDDRHGETVLRRARTCSEVPAYGHSLAAGRVSGAHLDALGAALRRIEPEHRDALATAAASLIGIAENDTLDRFRDRLNAAARKIRTDAGLGQLERQRRDTRLKAWINRRTGMYHLAGHFDPENGVVLNAALRSIIDALYANETPADAPAHPQERQDYLRALALLHLAQHGGTVTTEIITVIDLTTPVDDNPAPTIEWGIPVELPDTVLADWWPHALITPVVLCSGAIIHTRGQLNLGTTTRLASRAQRRALRARHRTCAIPGCTVAYDNCNIHHIIWWRNGGPTNLDNLIPVCTRHHTQIHNGDIEITLTPTRDVIVTPGRANAPPGTAAA